MAQPTAYLLPSFAYGGLATRALDAAQELARRESPPVVLALGEGPMRGAFAEIGCPTQVLPQRWRVDVFAIYRLRGELGRLHADMLHAWGDRSATYAACVDRSTPIWATRRPQLGETGNWGLEQLLARRIERTLVSTEAELELLVRRRAARDRIHVEPVTLPHTRQVGPGAPEPHASWGRLPTCLPKAVRTRGWLRDELDLPADHLLVAAIGPLTQRKQMKDLIWAADILRCVRSEFCLLIVGDGPHRGRLERYREEVQVQDVVRFLGPQADVPAILAECDVYWSAAVEAGHSAALVEAQAAGLPAVVPDSPGHRDLVRHGETGFLIPPGHRPSFAKHTLVLLEQADVRARMAACSKTPRPSAAR